MKMKTITKMAEAISIAFQITPTEMKYFWEPWLLNCLPSR